MSEENVQIARRAFDALQAGLAQGNPGAAFDQNLLAKDWEWIVQDAFEGRSVWLGREGWVEFMRLWTDQFDDWSFRVERLIDAGDDRVVALLHQSATGRESGIPVEWDNASVNELKDGRVIRSTNYNSHADALEAAGLSE